MNAFFSSRSKKNIFFDVDIVVNNKNVKIEIWFIVVCTLIDNEYASLVFSQTFFLLLLVLKGKSDAYKQSFA